MGDERFKQPSSNVEWLTLRTDSVFMADVAQEFVSGNEDRKRNFGTADNFRVAI